MNLSLGQAAKECGKSKSTISKALKSGKLSFLNKTTAGYEIDPAELFRVFPKTNSKPVGSNDQKPHNQFDMTTNMAMELGKIKAERDALEAQVAMLRETVDRERENTDEWRNQAKTNLKILTDKRAKEKGGFFGLFKKAS